MSHMWVFFQSFSIFQNYVPKLVGIRFPGSHYNYGWLGRWHKADSKCWSDHHNPQSLELQSRVCNSKSDPVIQQAQCSRHLIHIHTIYNLQFTIYNLHIQHLQFTQFKILKGSPARSRGPENLYCILRWMSESPWPWMTFDTFKGLRGVLMGNLYRGCWSATCLQSNQTKPSKPFTHIFLEYLPYLHIGAIGFFRFILQYF